MRILQERGRSIGFLLHSKVMHIPEYHERIYTLDRSVLPQIVSVPHVYNPLNSVCEYQVIAKNE